MNRELMLRVADAIEKEPKRYEQRHWIGNAGDPYLKPTKADYNRCGTVCCIAGHAIMQGILDGTRPEMPNHNEPGSPYFDWMGEAAKDLGITEWVADILFDADLKPVIPVPELLRKLANHTDEDRQLEILRNYA